MDSLLAELIAVQRLGILVGDSDGGHLVREFLVRRAGASDRLADVDGGHPGEAAATLMDAIHYAEELLTYDFLNEGTLGPLPADAPCWSGNERGYARQEHRAWITKHEI
ncbi:hypothetical protein [Streptomyces sp. NPDC057939]|uniref:hypothetical protein n=1 Tax=Streptomyces sp. NPDC057939 TaxID=3346284 RepID=UPI0036E29BB6